MALWAGLDVRPDPNGERRFRNKGESVAEMEQLNPVRDNIHTSLSFESQSDDNEHGFGLEWLLTCIVGRQRQ